MTVDREYHRSEWDGILRYNDTPGHMRDFGWFTVPAHELREAEEAGVTLTEAEQRRKLAISPTDTVMQQLLDELRIAVETGNNTERYALYCVLADRCEELGDRWAAGEYRRLSVWAAS